jgi:hypothetical protein
MFTPVEIEVGGNAYRIGRMPAMTLFHVTRRLTPLMSSLAGAVGKDGGQQPTFLDAAMTVAQDLAKLSDEDADYIIFACLAVVHRRVADRKWAPMVPAGTRVLAFEADMEMPELLQVVGRCLMEHLRPFFGPLLAGLGAAQAPGPTAGA